MIVAATAVGARLWFTRGLVEFEAQLFMVWNPDFILFFGRQQRLYQHSALHLFQLQAIVLCNHVLGSNHHMIDYELRVRSPSESCGSFNQRFCPGETGDSILAYLKGSICRCH